MALRRAARATAGGEGAVVTSPDVQSPAPDLLITNTRRGRSESTSDAPTPTKPGESEEE